MPMGDISYIRPALIYIKMSLVMQPPEILMQITPCGIEKLRICHTHGFSLVFLEIIPILAVLSSKKVENAIGN